MNNFNCSPFLKDSLKRKNIKEWCNGSFTCIIIALAASTGCTPVYRNSMASTIFRSQTETLTPYSTQTIASPKSTIENPPSNTNTLTPTKTLIPTNRPSWFNKLLVVYDYGGIRLWHNGENSLLSEVGGEYGTRFSSDGMFISYAKGSDLGIFDLTSMEEKVITINNYLGPLDRFQWMANTHTILINTSTDHPSEGLYYANGIWSLNVDTQKWNQVLRQDRATLDFRISPNNNRILLIPEYDYCFAVANIDGSRYKRFEDCYYSIIYRSYAWDKGSEVLYTTVREPPYNEGKEKIIRIEMQNYSQEVIAEYPNEYAIIIAPDAKKYVYQSDDGLPYAPMTLVDMTTHELLHNYNMSFFFIYDWSPDSTHFAFIGEDRKGYIADINGNIFPTPNNLDAFRTGFRWFGNESYFYCGKDSGLYWSSIGNSNNPINIIDKINCAVDYDYYY